MRLQGNYLFAFIVRKYRLFTVKIHEFPNIKKINKVFSSSTFDNKRVGFHCQSQRVFTTERPWKVKIQFQEDKGWVQPESETVPCCALLVLFTRSALSAEPGVGKHERRGCEETREAGTVDTFILSWLTQQP